jgi:hypothetical protein
MTRVKSAKRPAAAKKIDAEQDGPWDGDIAGDARNLSHLIDALVSSLKDVDFAKADGSRNDELDQVSALAWIARDLAEELMINTRK